MKTFYHATLFLLLLLACGKKKTADPALLTDAGLMHRNERQLTEVIIHDVFSPPVSSRIYAYTSLAAYEAMRFEDPSWPSFAASMQGFGALPQPEQDKSYNFLLAATRAFFTVAEKVTFSIDSLKQYQDRVYGDFRQLLDADTYRNSLAFGEQVGQKILDRSKSDHYKETRGMTKFLGSHETGKWRPTPPDYMDAAEPHWFRIKPLVLDSAGQVLCPPPPGFNMEPNSDFYRSVREVYDMTTQLSEEQKEIARFWDDNPFVIEHAGHMMYANKKVTPVGHWMGITRIACEKKKASSLETARAYALTSAAIFDVIISCWQTKYHYQHIRPVTVINESIDADWQPFLQTPPFPEHSSGHSGISASAATVLTKLFGEPFDFEDSCNMPYIGMKRRFHSFRQAAEEASISRVYGGIHYRTGVDAGAVQGKAVGELVSSLFLKEDQALVQK